MCLQIFWHNFWTANDVHLKVLIGGIVSPLQANGVFKTEDHPMCEFCLKHGEGKKWYLEASNYGEDLLNDLSRQKLFESFNDGLNKEGENLLQKFDDLDKAPAVVKRFIRWKTVRSMKKLHYGQIVPIEDVERIFEFVNSIIRVACLCRHIMLKKEKRYCYGVSMGPNGGKLVEMFKDLDKSFYEGPDSKGMEIVPKDEALAQFRAYEKEGLCHSVWTFKTPFIGGICNCDRPDCLAMQMSITHGIPVMFRAEYVAVNETDKCDGCKRCMKVCQFGAIAYSAAQKKVFIDPRRCYGCGICRSVCEKETIHLTDRVQVPVAARVWH
jgi:Pyruvate/2-oxoacid:ferredoxin oxidoreductase delta subunit